MAQDAGRAIRLLRSLPLLILCLLPLTLTNFLFEGWSALPDHAQMRRPLWEGRRKMRSMLTL
jgi:hypothetical protein